MDIKLLETIFLPRVLAFVLQKLNHVFSIRDSRTADQLTCVNQNRKI
jgi:hypothetical protein